MEHETDLLPRGSVRRSRCPRCRCLAGGCWTIFLSLSAERGWSSIYWHTRSDNVQARKLYDHYVTADEFVRYRLAIKP